MFNDALQLFGSIENKNDELLYKTLSNYRNKYGFAETYDLINNTTSYSGYNPLETAITFKNVYALNLLIEYGADVNLEHNGFNAYHFSFMKGPLKIIKITKFHAIVKSVPLSIFLLACVNYIKFFSFKECIKKVSELNGTEIVKHCMDHTKDENGTPLLHLAIMRNKMSLIGSMLSFNINTDVRFNGMCVLHLAMTYQRYGIIELFMKHGISIKEQLTYTVQAKSFTFTPLEFAIERNNPRMVRTFINAGALVDKKHDYLKYIFMCKEKSVLLVLFEKLKIDYLAGNGLLTFSKHLMMLNRLDMFEVLITSGVSLNTKWGISVSSTERLSVGSTLLHFAAVYTTDPLFTAFLCNHQANVNAKNIHHYTPLYYALFYKHYETANVLIHFGANKKIRSGNGVSAQDIINNRGLNVDENGLIIL